MKIYLAVNSLHYPDTLWCYWKSSGENEQNVRRWQLQSSPNRMIQHHCKKQQKKMMNAQKAVVRVFSHLSRWRCPNSGETRKHHPSREATRCQKYQPKNVLCGTWKRLMIKRLNSSRVVSLVVTSSLPCAQLISRCFSSKCCTKLTLFTMCATEWITTREHRITISSSSCQQSTSEWWMTTEFAENCLNILIFLFQKPQNLELFVLFKNQQIFISIPKKFKRRLPFLFIFKLTRCKNQRHSKTLMNDLELF